MNKHNRSPGRGFYNLKGKTISKVNAKAVNVVTFHFTDGTKYEIDSDELVLGATFREVWHHSPVKLPDFTGERIMMMPVIISNHSGIPEQYHELLTHLFDNTERRFNGKIGYLTIDERELEPGNTLRRGGLHVDGYYQGRSGAWGGGGGWGSVGNGMLTISNTAHCKAYLGLIDGTPGPEGEADHLPLPKDGYLFKPNTVYWVDGACVHESLPVETKIKRQFVRLSMPNNGPWFEGYTKNPTGIQPSGPILPRRDAFMS